MVSLWFGWRRSTGKGGTGMSALRGPSSHDANDLGRRRRGKWSTEQRRQIVIQRTPLRCGRTSTDYQTKSAAPSDRWAGQMPAVLGRLSGVCKAYTGVKLKQPRMLCKGRLAEFNCAIPRPKQALSVKDPNLLMRAPSMGQ